MSLRGIVRSGIAMGLVGNLLAGCGGGAYGGGGGSNPPANLTINVSPTAITVGQSATITWSSNGNTCTASGDWTGTRPGDGNETVTPAGAGTFTYSLRCRGGGYGDSEMGSATLTVSAATAATIFQGEACCIDSKAVAVTGLASDAGAYRFLALGTHVIGAPGKAPAVFEACGACLAGTRLADSSAVLRLALNGSNAMQGALVVKDAAARPQRLEFAALRDRNAGHAASVAALEGTYFASLSSGYTVTVTIDANGDVNGADTNGCVLRGRASAPRVAAGEFGLALDVSACGAADGRYRGGAALLEGGAGRPADLFLSASKRNSAIGWRLAR
jgi:hypothetical protein